MVSLEEGGYSRWVWRASPKSRILSNPRTLADKTVSVVRARCPVACASDLGRCDLNLGWLHGSELQAKAPTLPAAKQEQARR